MRDNEKVAIIIIISLSLILITVAISAELTKREAAQHGCAQYNSQTGAFEWLDTLEVLK